MQLTGLKYFVAVAEHGSFSAASEWLSVSVSTLTRSVTTLEEDLGLTLFERSKQGVTLTPAAGPVLTETKRMLGSLQTVTEVAAGAARGTRHAARQESFAWVFDHLQWESRCATCWHVGARLIPPCA